MGTIGYIVVGQKIQGINDSIFEFTSMGMHSYAYPDPGKKEKWLDWSFDEKANGNLQGFGSAKMFKTRKAAKNAITRAEGKHIGASRYIYQIVRIYY